VKAKLVIPAPAILLTHNKERALHHMERARIVKLWRRSAKVWAQVCKTPRFASAEVAVLIEQAKGKLADPGAHAPVIKACIDGLVDANVLLDDTGEYVTAVKYLPVVKGPKDQVTIGLIGELRGPDPAKVTGAEVLEEYRRKRAASVARQQKNCAHLKKPTGVCLDCGATC
jgi:hypothetical protein